ncbi:MAG: Gfo/Idh/MocA family oxidoreductase [Alphaproteobacteria bacterium]|nr:Gfo/Idh/MocA family oxidoreductase [Alphaproteobacteria bacterium]
MTDVIIVGLGRIGAGNIGLAGDTPMSHLAAVQAVRGLRITGLVDPDPEARSRVKREHLACADAQVVARVEDLPAGEGEVIAVCTPPTGRHEVVAACLARRPRVLVLEKPLADDWQRAAAILAQAKRANAALRVNFNRRFDPRFRRLRDAMTEPARSIIARYNGGLLNYGSHVVDLLQDWYGPVAEVRALGAGASEGDDPNLSFTCRMADGFDAVVLGLDGLAYDQMEIDVLFPQGRLELRGGGAEIRHYRAAPEHYYRGYTHLEEDRSRRDVGPVAGFAELYRAIAAHLDEGAPLPGCDGNAALANLAVLEAARRSANEGGRPVAPQDLVPDAA